MGDQPVGAGWLAAGDVIVIAPQAPYKDVPLTLSERPTSSSERRPAAVLKPGVELRIEAVRGSRAKVRTLDAAESSEAAAGDSEPLHGWIRLCAANGTPFVQPLWQARQEETGRPGTAAAAAGVRGTERELAALLEAHGISTSGCDEELTRLQNQLRRRMAVLEPRSLAGSRPSTSSSRGSPLGSESGANKTVVLRSDVAILQVVVGSCVLVETHREAPAGAPVAATTGRLPCRWRIAGESWSDCAGRFLRDVFGLTSEQLGSAWAFEDHAETSAGVAPEVEAPLPELMVEGERRRVVCRLEAPKGALAHAAPTPFSGVPFMRTCQGEEEAGSAIDGPVRYYYSWWSSALWRAVESGRGEADAEAASSSIATAAEEAAADIDDLPVGMAQVLRTLASREPTEDMRSSRLPSCSDPAQSDSSVLFVTGPVAGRRRRRPHIVQLLPSTSDYLGPATQSSASSRRPCASRSSGTTPTLWDVLGASSAQPTGAVSEGKGACGRELRLPGAAWEVPELADGGCALVTSLQDVVLAATAFRTQGAAAAVEAAAESSLAEMLASELPTLLSRLSSQIRELLLAAPEEFARSAESILASVAARADAESGEASAAVRAAYEAVAALGKEAADNSQWQPLQCSSHGKLDAAHVLADALGAVWLVDGGCTSSRPLLWDLASLSAGLLLDGTALPVAAAEFAALAAGDVRSGDVARWLGVSAGVARGLLGEAQQRENFLADPHAAFERVLAAQGRLDLRRRCESMILVSSEEAAALRVAADGLSGALVPQLASWGDLPLRLSEVEDADAGLAALAAHGWAAAAWSIQATLLRAGAAALGERLRREDGQQRRLRAVDTSPLLLLLPLLEASQRRLAAAAPWRKAWVQSHCDRLARMVAAAVERARAGLGPAWSPLWQSSELEQNLFDASAGGAVAFAEGMRLRSRADVAPPRHDESLPDVATDEFEVFTCSGPGDATADGASCLLGWPCASEGISIEDGWPLCSRDRQNGAAAAAPSVADAILERWREAAQKLRRSCAFRQVLDITAAAGASGAHGESLEIEVEADDNRHPLPVTGVPVPLLLHGRPLGSARLRQDGRGLILRIDQRTVCSPPCRAWASMFETIEVSLPADRRVLLRVQLSAPFFYYPSGARLAVCMPKQHASAAAAASGEEAAQADGVLFREGTVTGGPSADGAAAGIHQVVFDGCDEAIAVALTLGNHRPAGVFRYACGQRLVVWDGHAWRDCCVEGHSHDDARGGNRHRVEWLDRRAASLNGLAAAAGCWVDLNTFNHTPAWFSEKAFEKAAGAYRRRILSRHGAVPYPLAAAGDEAACLDTLCQPFRLRHKRRAALRSDDAWPPLLSAAVLPMKGRLEGLHSAPCCYAVGGAPLAGKSLLLKRLAASAARLGSEFLPVIISARDMAAYMESDSSPLAGDLTMGFLARISASSSAEAGEAADFALLRQALHSRRCLLLFDDVDLAGRMRPRIEAHLVDLARAGHRVVYTAATACVPGTASGFDDVFEPLVLLPLDERRQRLLLEQRLGAQGAAELVACGCSAVASGSPPMLLLLAGTVELQGQGSAASLPGGGAPAEAYEATLSTCLTASLGSAVASSGEDMPTAAALRRTLGKIAFQAHRRRLEVLTEEDLEGCLVQTGHRALDDERQALGWLIGAVKAGQFPLMKRRQSASGQFVLQFVHISLQEFLFAERAANHVLGDVSGRSSVRTRNDDDELVLPNLRTLLSEVWWTRVLDFLASGFPEQCTALLRQGLAAWELRRGPQEVSALYLAVQRGLTEAVRLLLRSLNAPPGGIQLRSKHMYGSTEETPLHQAASQGATQIVRLLLEHGAAADGFQANQVAPGGVKRETTPLFVAVERGHLSTAALLLSQGAPLVGQQCRGAATTSGGAPPGARGGGGAAARTCAEAASSKDMKRLLRRWQARLSAPTASPARAL
eukprot:TRINITY_DN36334_c0_g1_i1.p1 TRINITY_DN36334_c0_g1~~TRINITY_DN36334_c0_g1_i1.p1  ORF type:complete len:1936 (+),score=447.12 TRINITY_DN36334_c0_g1_i1:77-5884(+)